MFWIKYLGALIYDLLILIVLFFTFTGIILIANHSQAIPPSTLWYQLSLCMIALVYYYGSLATGGQTIGMRAWRFKLTGLTQDSLSAQHVIIRPLYILPATLIAPFYLKANYTLLNQWTKTRFIRID